MTTRTKLSMNFTLSTPKQIFHRVQWKFAPASNCVHFKELVHNQVHLRSKIKCKLLIKPNINKNAVIYYLKEKNQWKWILKGIRLNTRKRDIQWPIFTKGKANSKQAKERVNA